MSEHWLDRAVEDELAKVMDRYRSQGKEVHNVGRLRERVAADIQALRGTSQWGLLKNKYDPPPQNRLAWCRVCEKPVTMGSVSAWLEDKGGRVYCSQECKDAAPTAFLTLSQWKEKVRQAGSVTGTRKEIVDGELVDGEQFTITFDDIKDWSGSFKPPADPVPVRVVVDEIEWD